MAAGYDGSIRIDTRMDTKGFNKGVKAITGAIKGVALAMGVAMGITALIRWGKTAVDTAAQTEAAWIGLRSIVEGTGKSFVTAKEFLEEYISDGLVPMTNAITAYKNLMMRGYDTGQIEQTLTALKNASAFGRQASLTMGEAVQSATEGLKNENSILVDNSGVTKNVTIMWKEYAESIGTTVGNLTKQQKIQAEVNGIMNETRFQSGDAAKLADTYSGKVSALSTSFYNLRVAVGSAVIPLLSAVIPYIKKAVDWLVIFFNQAGQFIAALFGVKMEKAAQAIDSVTDSTADAAAAQGSLAKNTKKAGEAAKGALAAFDELNVLQLEEGSADAGVGGGEVAGGGTIGVPPTEPGVIDPNILTTVEKIKKAIGDAWKWIVEQATGAWNVIATSAIWVWDHVLGPVWKWISKAASDAWNWLKENVFSPIGEKLKWLGGVFKEAGQAIYEKFIEPVIAWFGKHLLPILRDVMTGIVALFKNAWQWIKETFASGWNLIVGILKNVGLAISGAIQGIITVIGGIVQFISGVFTDNWKKAWEGVKNIFTGVWQIIVSLSKGFVNSIIDVINAMIRSVISGINFMIRALNKVSITIPDWVPDLGGKSYGINLKEVSAPQIPHLATGAVIPPNAAFAAILGDQRHGTNIEAPEELIRQIVREETGAGGGEITINFGGSLGALVRELKPYIDKENARIGRSLVKGVTA